MYCYQRQDGQIKLGESQNTTKRKKKHTENQTPQQNHFVYVHEIFRRTGGDLILCSSNLRFTTIWDAREAERFPRSLLLRPVKMRVMVLIATDKNVSLGHPP